MEDIRELKKLLDSVPSTHYKNYGPEAEDMLRRNTIMDGCDSS